MSKKLSILLSLMMIAALAGDSLAAESPVQSDRVKSIGLFKNGLAYVSFSSAMEDSCGLSITYHATLIP